MSNRLSLSLDEFLNERVNLDKFSYDKGFAKAMKLKPLHYAADLSLKDDIIAEQNAEIENLKAQVLYVTRMLQVALKERPVAEDLSKYDLVVLPPRD